MTTESALEDGRNPETEYLVVWISQDLGSLPEVNIYGNPAGLRRLAATLNQIADYDQSLGAFPDDDSFHCHLDTGRNTRDRDPLPRVTLGRVDSKDAKQPVRSPFPEIDPKLGVDALTDIHL